MHRFALSVAALAVVSALPAQQNVAIYISRGISTISGVLCGFDCSSPTNLGTAVAQVNDQLDFRVIGDVGTVAFLAFTVGNALPCPGQSIPGVGNALLLDPALGIETAALALSVSGGGRTQCNPTGGLERILAGLVIPPVAQGLTVTWQGAVVDSGTFSFTRAIELAIQ